MTKSVICSPEGLPDVLKIASGLADAFNLDEASEMALANALPYMRPERFAMSYADGAGLVLERAFGAELRALVARPNLSSHELMSMDRLTFETAGYIEHFDYHGIERSMGIFKFVDDYNGNLGARDQPRIAPILPSLMMPPLREALVVFLEQHTGKKADERDWIKKPDKLPRPRKGSATDFYVGALVALGWQIDLKEMCETHQAVLDANIRWDDYRLPEATAADEGTNLESSPAQWNLAGSLNALTGETTGTKFKIDRTFVDMVRKHAVEGGTYRFDRHVCSDCGDDLVVYVVREPDGQKHGAIAFAVTRAGFPKPVTTPHKLVAHYAAIEGDGFDTCAGPDHRCF